MTSTVTHRTVFIIVIEKEKKQLKVISFKAILDVKNFGLLTIPDVNFSDNFFPENFFVQFFFKKHPIFTDSTVTFSSKS